MDIRPSLNPESEIPLYRQLGAYLQHLIEQGDLHAGDRLRLLANWLANLD